MSAGTLVRNYGEKYVAHAQKDQPPTHVEQETPFPNKLATNKHLTMGQKGFQNL
jgi:hypothetical protein